MLIVGTGRSGTNWLTHMFDASADTFCRSEPLDIASSPVHRLPTATAENDAHMADAWDYFVRWTTPRRAPRRSHPRAKDGTTATGRNASA